MERQVAVSSVFVVDACRTPIGKVKGALAEVRPDHLAADILKALIARNGSLDVNAIDDVYWGAANQAGEDNRNVARMAVLLAGLPVEIPGATVNRLCGSGMEAVSDAARAIAAGDADICVAGGTESMTRAPFVVTRSGGAWGRSLETADPRPGGRLVTPRMQELSPPISLGETAENVADKYGITRDRQGEVARAPATPGPPPPAAPAASTPSSSRLPPPTARSPPTRASRRRSRWRSW